MRKNNYPATRRPPELGARSERRKSIVDDILSGNHCTDIQSKYGVSRQYVCAVAKKYIGINLKAKEPKKIHKKCEYCHFSFDTRAESQRYCSRRCAGMARRIPNSTWIYRIVNGNRVRLFERICPYCNSSFYGQQNQKHCSHTCAQQAAWKRRTARTCGMDAQTLAHLTAVVERQQEASAK